MERPSLDDPFGSASVWADVATPATNARASLTSAQETQETQVAQVAQVDINDAVAAATIAAADERPSPMTNGNAPVAAAPEIPPPRLRPTPARPPPQPQPPAAFVPNPLFDLPASAAFNQPETSLPFAETKTSAFTASNFDPLSLAAAPSDPSLGRDRSISLATNTILQQTSSTASAPATSIPDHLAPPLQSSDNASTRPIPPSDTSMTSDDDPVAQSKPALDTLHDPLLSPLKDPLSMTDDDRDPDLDTNSSANLSHKLTSSQNGLQKLAHDFDVNVTEPTKIGEALSSHTSYKIRTKTNSPDYRNPEFAVNRRFRDFLWLYNQLIARYPGVIVPPVPEKHAIGRFQEEFVETRRMALERFIRKVVAHPILQPDADVRLFLESETFNSDKKSERKTGFMNAFGETTPQVNQPFPKVSDNDPVLESRRQQAENIETQLKALSKALEFLMKQRRDLGQATLELGDSLVGLANIEQNQTLSGKLIRLGNIHKRIRDLQEKQGREDLYHIFSTVEEHIRVVGSVKIAYASRAKSYAAVVAAETNLARRVDALAKVEGSMRVRTDKIAGLRSEMTDAQNQLETASREFRNLTNVLVRELDRVEREKTADFTESMKLFLASLMDTQSQIIEAWQSYFSGESEQEATIVGETVPTVKETELLINV